VIILAIVLKAIMVTILGLILGDFLSTFIYHVPEHAFGKFHVTVHHSKNKDFYHYAVLSPQWKVLLDGVLGIAPYFLLLPIFLPISVSGCILCYLCGQFHVIWRHTTALSWQTPEKISKVCQYLGIITPEFHWQYHKNGHEAFGDIFVFYDKPARAWLKFLLNLKRRVPIF